MNEPLNEWMTISEKTATMFDNSWRKRLSLRGKSWDLQKQSLRKSNRKRELSHQKQCEVMTYCVGYSFLTYHKKIPITPLNHSGCHMWVTEQRLFRTVYLYIRREKREKGNSFVFCLSLSVLAQSKFALQGVNQTRSHTFSHSLSGYITFGQHLRKS